MSNLGFLGAPPVFIEISQGWMKAFQDGSHVQFPLERGAGGRLTPASRDFISNGLRAFARKKSLSGRARAWCAISANGVSVRRLTLPAVSDEEMQKLLRLQIETDLPLPPDDLAWGFRVLPSGTAPGKRDVLVAAVRKEVVEDYATILAACGLDPVFTPALLAASYLCAQPGNHYAVLDTAGSRPEWAVFENQVPTIIRVLASVAEHTLLDSVSNCLEVTRGVRRIYVTSADADLLGQLVRRFTGIECLPLEATVVPGATPAMLGLRQALEQGGVEKLLLLRTRPKPESSKYGFTPAGVRPWLIRAAALVCLLLLLPYLEALTLKPHLVRKLESLKSETGRLKTVDHELDFLQTLKLTQPPYEDALYLLAKSAPPGARFEAVSMNRRGEMSLKGTLQNGQLVTDLRSKLIASGFFSSVAVEEQTPSPDRQKVNVRITATWKAPEDRANLAFGPTAEEIAQAKTNNAASTPGGFPPGMMPPMMMMPMN